MTRSGTLATFATLAVIAASVPARAADTLLPYSDTVRQGLMAAAAGRVRVDPPALATAHTPALTVPAAFTDLARKPATVPWTELVLAEFVKHKTSPNRAAPRSKFARMPFILIVRQAR